MLFISSEFIFIFLPITVLFFYFLITVNCRNSALIMLVVASLFFYAWWNYYYLALILFSIIFNYLAGRYIKVIRGDIKRKKFLAACILVNLLLLGYFKYTNFLIAQVEFAFDVNFSNDSIILPLAISFFTFQQITFLIDSYRGDTKKHSFLHYCLFVTFFPQLIAGPIVHHKEILPQFTRKNVLPRISENIAIGVSIFSIGLFKKVIIADSVAAYASGVFDASEIGVALTLFEAWGGALAYTIQLYFDFSGYSDMAIGIAYMFGVRLPINFNSPYKAGNLIEFWKRWHMTLSRFLRDYVYFSLGGNRKGESRRYVNIFITMILGGIWHGAGWTFLIWGLLHGMLLTLNHIWHALIKYTGSYFLRRSLIYKSIAKGLTFITIVTLWVPFRAETFTGAVNIFYSMWGLRGISLSRQIQNYINIDFLKGNSFIFFDGMFHNYVFGSNGNDNILGILAIIISLVVIWFSPNTQQLFIKYYHPTNQDQNETKVSKLKWSPSFKWAFMISFLLAISISFILNDLIPDSEFLYFQF
jgi:alginate O-acetyltransferase complex protein AlgI